MTAWSACSVKEKCGPTGMECRADDRACQSDAVARGLEVVCETRDAEAASTFVYCPAGMEQRDSGVVWLLLLAAVLVAVVGGALVFIVVRKK